MFRDFSSVLHAKPSSNKLQKWFTLSRKNKIITYERNPNRDRYVLGLVTKGN